MEELDDLWLMTGFDIFGFLETSKLYAVAASLSAQMKRTDGVCLR